MKKIYLAVFLVAAMFACSEQESRIPEFLNAPNFRMQLRPDNSYFNFADINSAKLVYDVYSENYNDIESVEISFRYQKNGNPNCANRGCLGPFVVKTYSADELAAAQGILEGQEITIQDVVNLLGLTTADLTGGDQFFFLNTTTMKDGRVYPSVTVGANDNVPAIYDQPGASFTGSFNAIVGCPLQDAFTGNYSLEQVQGDVNWNGGGPTDPIFAPLGTVSLTAVNPITRSLNVTYLGFTGRPMTFILLCGNSVVPNQSSGLSCGGPAINWVSAGVEGMGGVLATYDPADDSVIELQFIDNQAQGCGDPPDLTILRLTKL